MTRVAFYPLLALLFILVGCTHSISHKPLANSLPPTQNDLSVVIVIPPETKNFTETHSNLSGDKWIFEVGHSLFDIAPQIFRNQYGSVMVTDSVPASFQATPTKHLVILKILSFETDIGWTVFSRHYGTLTLNVEASGISNVNTNVSASGSDSGGNYAKTYGALILPTVGISGYNEAMSVMISNSTTATVVKALKFVRQSTI